MSIARHHAEWLALIDISGPFLSLRALAQAFPQGLDAPDADVARELRLAYEEWLDNSLGTRPDVALHLAWVEWVLRRVLGQPEGAVRVRGDGDEEFWQRFEVTVPEHGERLRPDFAIVEPGEGGKPRILVQVVPAGQDLERAPARAAWQASPATRMMTLLRGAGVRLGLLTNGEQWMLVDRPADENFTTGFASWYARLWLDEPLTLRAFRSLLGAQRLFGVPDTETLEALLAASVNDRQEVTDQLGYQVRRAVDLLVQALDLADQNEGRRLLREVPPERLYEASLTVMMRLVFLLFAEEQSLLLLGDDVYDRNYAASTLLETLREAADRVGEEVLERRYDAWGRLLAIFRAVYGGFRHDRLTMPAYGGRLFDPDRYPFMEGRDPGSSWQEQEADPPQISNRTVLHLLEALQVLRMRVRDGAPIETRRLSFRALDIEQIGHVYEGLLDHTALRAAEPILGLAGTRDQEPEIALATLEAQAARGEPAFLAYLQEQTGRSASALKKAYAAPLDAFRATLLRAACGNDEALYARVLPFAGLVRDDDYGRPAVIPAGSVYVTAGAERRATGTHYTPRSLTEPIVQHTLEPLVYHGPAEGLPREEWELHPAAKLLQLTVCDMAMGSGAFLVQACRYLAERLLEAWAAAEGAKEGERRLVTPEGFPTLEADEAVPADPDERLVFARRLVADRCLYGVDKNPLAAEMAKLSLWMITLAKGRPFSFLDHALRAGDSLLGISTLEQLMNWSFRKGNEENPVQIPLIRRQVEEALEVALRERRKIASTLVREVRDADLKAGWLSITESALALVRLGADLLVATELVPDKSVREILRKDWLTRYSLLLSTAEDIRAGTFPVSGQSGAVNREVFAQLRAEAERYLENRRPFHWPLEFVEIFSNLSGFSAIVGNPPFIGGKRISIVLGSTVNNFIKSVFEQSKGASDYVAYFFRQAFSLIATRSCVGMIATNSLSETDTREVGIEYIMRHGGVIYRASRSREWPGTAGVAISIVHIIKGLYEGSVVLDGQRVMKISAILDSESDKKPFRLASYSDRYTQGPTINGEGFIISKDEYERILGVHETNKDVLSPYLNGDILNNMYNFSTPEQYVINFRNWPLEKASSYSEPFSIVNTRVRPKRESLSGQIHEHRFWLHWDRRENFFQRYKATQRFLVSTITTKYLTFTFVSANWYCSHAIKIFAIDDNAHFAVLQSSIHEYWARKYSSQLETRLRYSTSDAFDTFPFPSKTESNSKLNTMGDKYYSWRESMMIETKEGLTKTYNRFHDPKERSEDIAEMRRLHVEMDNAVAAAYGWADLELGHGFHETKQGLRYTINEAARREVLDRLLRLNHERYAEEVAAGLHDKGAKKAAKAPKPEAAKAPKKAAPQPQLAFDLGDPAPSSPAQPQLALGLDAPAPAAQHTATNGDGDAYARLTALLEQRGALTNGDVQAALGIDAEAARALLRRLVEEGRAAVEGQRRGTRYVRRG